MIAADSGESSPRLFFDLPRCPAVHAVDALPDLFPAILSPSDSLQVRKRPPIIQRQDPHQYLQHSLPGAVGRNYNISFN